MRVSPLHALALVLLVTACQNEPRTASVREVPRRSASLGLPDRVLQPGPDGRFTSSTAVEVDLMASVEIPGELSGRFTPDSISVVMNGKRVRLVVTLPPHEDRELAGVRFVYRGTLGGRLGLSWREARASQFHQALSSVQLPGGGQTVDCALDLGPTRQLGRHVSALGIELPGTEVGTISLAGLRMVLQPAGATHRVDLDGDVREVLAPGPLRRMEWDVVVPESGRLVFDYATHPGMRVSHGDGTRFRAELIESATSTLLLDRWLSVFAVPAHRGWQSADLDLSEWSGRRVTLRLSTLPGPDAHGIFPASAEIRDDDPLFTIPRLVAAGDERPNILLIVVDTLRRDGLGCYGGGPSPVIDSLATAGIRYERAWSAGSWTHPSVVSLLSGWNPSRHGLGFGPAGTTQRDPKTPMLAAELRDAGWATAAVSNNRIVSVEEGFAEGFTTFDETAFVEDQIFGAQRVTRSALEWIEDHPRGPWFLYLHYFDPHDRYQAPPPFTRMHVPESLDRSISDSSVRGGRPNPFMEGSPARRELTEDERRYLRGLYRGEISYLDYWLGKLFADLESNGALENTIVVLTSDHGEEFLEHGGLKHGHTLYEELVAVPLVLLRPDGLGAGSVVSSAVSLLDLAPTLRALVGLPASAGGTPWPPIERESTRPVAENWRDGDGVRSGLQRALLDWPNKLIEYGGGARLELYDLAADPAERSPLPDEASIGRLLGALDSLLGEPVPMGSDAKVDSALLEKLKAMGYVH